MKKTFSLFLLVLSVALVSCDREDKYITEDDVIEFESKINPEVKDIVWIDLYDQEIYYLETVGGTPVKLTNQKYYKKMMPRISPDHTKLAFVDSSFHPLIIALKAHDGHKVGDTLMAPRKDIMIADVMEWNPNADPSKSDGLYYLYLNEVGFTGATLPMPDILFTGNTWHSVAFDKKGFFYFLITNQADPEQIKKLYRWDPNPAPNGTIKRMTIDEQLPSNSFSQISCAENGDLLLKVGLNVSPGYDTYYIYPSGSLKHTIKGSGLLYNDVWWNGSLKQAMVFGYNPIKLRTEMTVKNHTGYARSEDKSIDTAKVNDVVYFNWK